MSYLQHKKETPSAISCKVITVSDTRTDETDKSGQTIMRLLKENGHETAVYEIVKDEADSIRRSVLSGLEEAHIDAIILNGGTGVAPRDVTIETITPLLDKELPGFGEIFRMLSYQEDIGPGAILSRAAAGTAGGKAVFSCPGSTGAVRLAMNKLILPELGHIIRELKK
ncbi:MogA/MoaB family molybdenum cofactor biosynthesis protein [Peribacillus kribbensis]|uniref:MogA/MoaB family molybdenum cofactor biosynthesis protein n=1 Tax=Peribacillus kribbensis TaxID=356658 RepID=UPI0003F4BF7A|nr:molybdenum cofactor biosynthesis protein B [Peribacillus kribbensis]